MDGNNYLEIVEFLLLFKHLEPNKFSYVKARNIYEKSSEKFKNSKGLEVMGLTFGQFAVICTEYDIFRWERQYNYLGLTDPQDIINAANNLFATIELKTQILMNRLRPVNMWITYFSQIINNIKLFSSKGTPRLSKSIYIYIIYIYI